jgi:two-component system CheB/CheR fusion protein
MKGTLMSNPPEDGALDALLAYVNERRGFDFRGYKRGSLSRRILKRMLVVGADDYQQYMEILEANPSEFSELFNTILINVTSLLRDREAWDKLAGSIIPALTDNKNPDAPVRVWSAGCASGEEAYSLAVLLADAIGEERFRRSVKIYATDADNDALVVARHGRYKEQSLIDAFGEDRTERYFEREGGYGTFRSDLRRALIFGRHDLVQDPPISRIDLVACRNTLMYFTSEVQLKVLGALHFALVPGGYLFLGKSEALVSRTQLFEAIDLRQRIFRKDGSSSDVAGLSTLVPGRARATLSAGSGRIADSLFENSAIAQMLIDPSLTIVLANKEARRLFSLGSADATRPLRDAEAALRPSDLRTPVERALRKRQQLVVHDVVWDRPPDGSTLMDIVVSPLEAHGGVILAFVDVTRYQHLRDELEQSQRELESAYEELQSAVEELETTNEELQSTNEELETTNEELHSTNEELETMNEELQSTNEELETMNNELRDRGVEVDELNRFLQSILGSLQSAVVVLGPEMEVQAWNHEAEELWGLRSSEVEGQHFLNLDIGFPVDRLRSAIRDGLSGRVDRLQITQPAVNRRGRAIDCVVNVTRLIGDGEASGVILMMDAIPRDQATSPDGADAPSSLDGDSPAKEERAKAEE